jgi:hypothetical protein
MHQGMGRSRSTLVAAVAGALFLIGHGAALGQGARSDAEWSRAGRSHAYVHDLIGPGAILGVAGATALDQVRDDPAEWGRNAQGLGHRAATNAASNVVAVSVRHGLAAALGRSTRYQPCGCSGFGPRIGHALVETFTDRDRAGARMVSIPRLGGAVAGALSQRIWRPSETSGDTAFRIAGSLLFSVASNVASELMHRRP